MKKSRYRNIIEFAIANEIEAEEFYSDAAKKVGDPYIKKMFNELADEEKRHQKILKGILARESIGGYFTEDRDYKVAETIEKPKLSTDMQPADAIALAVKNEEEAMKQYTGIAKACTDPDIEELFLDLAAMEREHKFKMEKAFVDIGYPEVW